MIHIVTHANRLYYQAQILAMHQHRSRLAQGAHAHLSGDDARGWDEFDDDEAVYLMALGRSGDIQSTVRIRPTVGRGLMSERHPELTYPQEGPMRGVETWEISRFFVAPSQDPTTQNPGVWRTSDLILAAMEHASRAGATRIVGLNAVPNFDRQRAANINIRMIGPVQEDGDLAGGYRGVPPLNGPDRLGGLRAGRRGLRRSRRPGRD